MFELLSLPIIEYCLGNINCKIWFERCIQREIQLMEEDLVMSHPFEVVKEGAFYICKQRARTIQF